MLKNTRAPAFLFEAGIIVNREEEILLASTTYQDNLSAALVAAVERFCGARASSNPR